MNKYNHSKIEAKWQKYWQIKKTFLAKDFSKKPKKYILTEFPYPSGEGLHMGHLRPYVAADVFARYHRLKGNEVIFPMGWDAFGLPAENYAIKTGVNPAISTKKNVANAKRQLQSWGMSFDWSREVNTTDPECYKWTQWLFLQFYKAGLAYEATGLINWCPKDKTGLANEEVIDGRCERCGTIVEKKELRQWYLRITSYAEKLLEGLKNLPKWPEPVKLQQENWIGRSEGITYKEKIKDLNIEVEAYDSVPQTFMAQTFAVIAPEHQLLKQLVAGTEHEKPVMSFVEQFKKRKSGDKFSIENETEGIFTGRYIENPFGTGDLPLWVATFVIADYGSGIVNCSAHDERDFAFAKKYNIPLKTVMLPADPVLAEKVKNLEVCYHHAPDGILQEPTEFRGSTWAEARADVINYIEKHKFGYRSVNYKLRDWVFSRQRYWGEPIPIIHCATCGIVPVPEKDLPVKLPPVKNYQPTGTGESPLAAIKSFVNVKCPKCKSPAKRETNTMPQWAGSSWYWLRYTDPRDKKSFAEIKKQKYWTPVDVYFGGMEHTTLHLLYSRFWNLFLYDQKLVTVREPYVQRKPHGIILGPDGEKMSKSRGNVVNPDTVVKSDGADTLRMYELFLGPHEATVSWNERGHVGVKRFLDRVWNWIGETQSVDSKQYTGADSDKLQRALNRLIKKVTEDIENFRFNTSVSAFMEFHNEVKDEQISLASLKTFLILLYPFAPHIAEELNEVLSSVDNSLGRAKRQQSLQSEQWPSYNEALTIDQTVEIIVQINGKVKGKLPVARDAKQEAVEAQALKLDAVKAALVNETVKRAIYVPNRILNLVI